MTLRSAGLRVLAVAAVALAAPGIAQNMAAPDAPAYGPPTPPELRTVTPVGVRPLGISDPLYRAVEQAVATYPAISAAKSALRGASADVRGAKWLQFPSVSVEGLAIASGNDSFENTIQVDQPIWAGGRISGTIRRAQAIEQAAAAEVNETALTVALQLSTAYFEMARLARRQAILESSVTNHDKLVDSIARRVEQGVSPDADLELARSRAATVKQELSLTVAQRYTAIQRFVQLVGTASFDVGNVPPYDAAIHHPSAMGAVEQAITCSPRRQRLLSEAKAAQADYDIAKAQILPQLSAQLSHNEFLGTRFGLALRAQTDGGLSRFAAADAALFRKQSSELAVATAEREIREQIINDLVENQAAKNRIGNSSIAVISSAAVTESYQRQFVAGRRTWLDVMNAVREATTAELSAADAEVSAMASTARLLLNTCRWQPEGARVEIDRGGKRDRNMSADRGAGKDELK